MSALVHGDVDQVQLNAFVKDSASSKHGNKDGSSFCGERGFEILNLAEVESFISLPEFHDVVTLQSTSKADIGRYEVSIRIYLINSPDIGRIETFTATVNPCLVESFTTVETIGSFTYEVGIGRVTTSPFRFAVDPAACDIQQEVRVTGNPAYMLLDLDRSVLVVENDDEKTLETSYTVTIVSKISYPTDYTMSSYDSREQSFSFTLDIVNPWLVDCNEVTIHPFPLNDLET